MKKLLIYSWLPMLFAAMATFSLTACSDDEEEDLTNYYNLLESIYANASNGNGTNNNYNTVECEVCDGTGDCPGSNCDNGYCFRCDGLGYTYYGSYKHQCMYCRAGKCTVCSGRDRCPTCAGKGYVTK